MSINTSKVIFCVKLTIFNAFEDYNICSWSDFFPLSRAETAISFKGARTV